MNRFVRSILALFLPERCVFCGAVILPMQVSCSTCRRSLSIVSPPICTYCGQSKTDCHCAKHRHHFDAQAAPFYHEKAARFGVLRLKRWDDPEAISFFTQQMATVVHREYEVDQIDGIVFVPMTKREVAKRGYNQGKLLAEALGKRLDLPVYDILKKLYETTSQKELKGIQRTGNVLGVFDVTVPSVAGKTLLLVDDVMTTGSTAGECAKMLKIYGAKRVLCVAIAIRKREKKESLPKT
ncbi:MAG: ComF family protein [Clostridia bacterium]|nr:ComF family protein [Clostridia bacterium]